MPVEVKTDQYGGQFIEFTVTVYPSRGADVDFEALARDFDQMLEAAVNGSDFFDRFELGWKAVNDPTPQERSKE